MKKMYIQPITEQEQLVPSSIVLAGSPNGTLTNSNQGTNNVDTGGGDLIGN